MTVPGDDTRCNGDRFDQVDDDSKKMISKKILGSEKRLSEKVHFNRDSKMPRYTVHLVQPT